MGRFYAGTDPRARPVSLELDGHGRLLAEPRHFEPLAITDTRISSRVGSTPRTITLPSGAVIETDDHATLDRWQAKHGLGRNLAHRFERRLSMALAALVCVLALVAGGAVWGVPWASSVVAGAMPAHVAARLGDGTLETLDRWVFGPTQLDIARRHELRNTFDALVPGGDHGFAFRLEFRDGRGLGANAFALPDGTVILTDQLIDLADDDEEIAAVLLHEIGHVVHRHSLRQVISHVGLAALTAALFGDVSAAGSLVLATESSYSRAMEWEADSYALERMHMLGLPPERFADLFERMAGHAEPGWLKYLSTHPPTEERIARFRNHRGG